MGRRAGRGEHVTLAKLPIRFLWLPILLVGAVVAAAAPVDAGRLPAVPLSWEQVRAMPGGEDAMARELDRRRIQHERWHQVHDLLGEQHISRRSQERLRKLGLGPARIAAPEDGAAKAGVDTLRILLVRIAFETNRDPHLVTMAEDGDFFYEPRYPGDPLPIDPEPHDKAFFESHLRGLAEYYDFQSGGRLHIDARVLPEGDRDSYKLGDVADYGPGADGWWTLEGLESLVRDMITAADEGTQADGSVDLGDYDDDDDLTYIIFAHAGSDWQSDVNIDSPNDIPTFFVTLGEAQPLINGSLTECSVIPETTTQDGYKGSIAAALYHEFGHALGLPDVYDATTGYTSVGVWDLMDSGTNLAANLGYIDEETGEVVPEPVTGILPPSLSAWCKWFLGWVETDVVSGGEGVPYKLPAVGVPRDRYSIHDQVAGNDFDPAYPQVLVGGASSGEFFLVENRWVPLTVADTPYDPYDPESNYGGLYFKTDTELGTGVVLYLAGDRRGVTGINTGYYDYFLPEGGVLVWQANMDRIEAGLADNTINAYGDGLKLVEADGIQDVGTLDAYVLGWYGSALDVFAPWNEFGYLELFTEGAGVPSSRAQDRSWTGLHLWDIADDGQAHGAVMRLMGAVEPLQTGWPVILPATGTADVPLARGLDAGSLTPVADTDGRMLLTVLDAPADGGSPVLFAWSADGAAAYAATAGLPDGGVWQAPDVVCGSPAVLTDPMGDDLLVIASADGTVSALSFGAAGVTEAWAVAAADSLVAGPQPVSAGEGSTLAAFVSAGGSALLLDHEGVAVGDSVSVLAPGYHRTVAPLRAAITDGTGRLLIIHDNGWSWLPVEPSGFAGGGAVWTGRLEAPATVALLPVDEGHRLMVFGPDGLQGAWLLDGDAVTADRWPDPGTALCTEPAVADLDADGRLDVVAATASRLFAWQDDGTPLTGYPNDLANMFPLPDTTAIAGPLVVADFTGGAANDLVLATDAGHLLILDERGRAVPGTPFRFGDAGASGMAVVPLPSGRMSLAVASAGGVAGPPLDRRLTNGRVALYADRPLPADGPATAAWFGTGGGAARSGPVGEARVVAGEDPAASGAGAVVYYPNPMTGTSLTVRFWSATNRPADLAIYNLQGEEVHRAAIATQADRINEYTVELDVASGLYVARLTCEQAAGRVESQVRTVAVAR
jgi:M6 family metalloprotease-like protein